MPIGTQQVIQEPYLEIERHSFDFEDEDEINPCKDFNVLATLIEGTNEDDEEY